MQAVNLLPADARVSTSRFSTVGSGLPTRKTLQIGGGVAAALALLLAGLYVHERSVLNNKQSTLTADQTRLAAVQAQVDAIRSQLNDSRARGSAAESVVNLRMNWDRTMSALAHVLPVDVVLNNLQAAAPVQAATAGVSAVTTAAPSSASPVSPAALTITGVAPSHVRVGTVMDRLAILPWLSDVALVSSTRQADGTTSFTLTAGVSEVH
jgi:Tfp pilus assembly protein PilN